MVLQVEDCTDVLIALHPKFDILFLFNHYCVHDRGGEDGLNVNRMGIIYYGLLHPETHLTNIKQESGYIGTHPCIFKPGQVHNLVLQYNVNGPL